MALLSTEIRGGVALLTLEDPGRRNAISQSLAEELSAALASLAEREEPRALVMTGAPPAFSAGADLDDLEGATRDSLRRIYRGFLAVAEFPLPTIAAVNGPAVGAGLNLALACDLRLAARSARFESRFLQLGLHPGGGHTWMLRRLLGPQGAAALALFGEALDGEEAARRGLAWSCVPDGELIDEALRLAGRLASLPTDFVRRLRGTLSEMGAVRDHDEAVERELEAQLWSLGQPAFRERLAALRRRIAGRRPGKS
jgi:enoyl-CoA hydratase